MAGGGLEVNIRKKLNEFALQISFCETEKRIGILGESGSGKSMTLKCIAGIIRPDEGLIRMGNHIFFSSAEKYDQKPQKRRIGYLFQNYALFPTMTVAENIAAGLTGSRAEIKMRVEEMAERFRLTGLLERYPKNLSGGQQQRTALARLMAYRPEMILLDEPFSAMDTFLKDQLQEQLSEMLQDYAGTMLMVSHDRDEIYRFCRKVLVLDRGQIIRSGKTQDVFANPKVRQVAQLTGCKNFCSMKRLDAHSAKLLDWGIDLVTERKIPEGCSCIGYRAHAFCPVWGKAVRNSFPVSVLSRADLPFETNYYLRPQGKVQSGNPERISWFVQQKLQRQLETRGMPDYLQLEEEQILFL